MISYILGAIVCLFILGILFRLGIEAFKLGIFFFFAVCGFIVHPVVGIGVTIFLIYIYFKF